MNFDTSEYVQFNWQNWFFVSSNITWNKGNSTDVKLKVKLSLNSCKIDTRQFQNPLYKTFAMNVFIKLYD